MVPRASGGKAKLYPNRPLLDTREKQGVSKVYTGSSSGMQATESSHYSVGRYVVSESSIRPRLAEKLYLNRSDVLLRNEPVSWQQSINE